MTMDRRSFVRIAGGATLVPGLWPVLPIHGVRGGGSGARWPGYARAMVVDCSSKSRPTPHVSTVCACIFWRRIIGARSSFFTRREDWRSTGSIST